LLRRWRSKG